MANNNNYSKSYFFNLGSYNPINKPYSGQLGLTVRGTDPEEIAKIANVWTSLVSKESLKLRVDEVQNIYKMNLKYLNLSKKRMTEITSKLETEKPKANLSQLGQELNMKQAQLITQQVKLASVSSKLLEKKARGSSLSSKNSSQNKIDLSNLKPASIVELLSKLVETLQQKDVIYIESTGPSSRTEYDLQMLSDQFQVPLGRNEEYKKRPKTTLKKRQVPGLSQKLVINTYVNDADVTPKMKQLYVTMIEKMKKELQTLEAGFLKQQLKINKIEKERALVELALVDLIKKVADIKMLLFQQTSDVRHISPAVVPHLPARPDVNKIVWYATILSFFVALIFCILREYQLTVRTAS